MSKMLPDYNANKEKNQIQSSKQRIYTPNFSYLSLYLILHEQQFTFCSHINPSFDKIQNSLIA